MSHCPSRDWDRHADEMDEAMDEAIEAERMWWVNNADRVLQVACAIVNVDGFKLPTHDERPFKNLVEMSSWLVSEVTDRGMDQDGIDAPSVCRSLSDIRNSVVLRPENYSHAHRVGDPNVRLRQAAQHAVDYFYSKHATTVDMNEAMKMLRDVLKELS